MNLFKIGDFIKSKNPYEGESEKLIVEIEDNYYICVGMKGKYCYKPNFNIHEGLHIEYTNSYEKVG